MGISFRLRNFPWWLLFSWILPTRIRTYKVFLIAGIFFFLIMVLINVTKVASPLQQNFVDHPEILRRQYFGKFKWSLTAEEERSEDYWKARHIYRSDISNSCDVLVDKPKSNNSNPFLNISKIQIPYTPVQSSKTLTENYSEDENKVKKVLERDGFQVEHGGWFKPSNCMSSETVAIIVPYRDRHENLMLFLNYMHRFLQHQRRRYVIIVAEQTDEKLFNRAKLLNSVFHEIVRDYPQVECFILHDVDKLPFHAFNMYKCEFHPKQLATMKWFYETNKEQEYYEFFFGGATTFLKWQLLRMNGGSNVFYGWGGEDDDLIARAILSGHPPIFPSKETGKMIIQKHHNDTFVFKGAYQLLNFDNILHRMKTDGLRQTKYFRSFKTIRPLYTLYGLTI